MTKRLVHAVCHYGIAAAAASGMPTHSPDCFGLFNRQTAAVIGQQKGPRAHVLVCAPSNAALDEVVLRVLQHGLLDGSGARYDPSIVRIGVNVHHSVKQVALESLVDAKLGVTDRVRWGWGGEGRRGLLPACGNSCSGCGA
jgi:hypothetical protein